MKAFNRAKKKMESIPLSIKAKASPESIKLNEKTILSADVSGGDYDYIYEWKDPDGNIIAKDPNSGEDDGTREVTPYIPKIINNQAISSTLSLINKFTGMIEIESTKYTCKVTDKKGKGTSQIDTIKVNRI